LDKNLGHLPDVKELRIKPQPWSEKMAKGFTVCPKASVFMPMSRY